jgi:hypothetical protein
VTPPDRHVTPSLVWLEPARRAGIAIYRAPSTDTVMSQECFVGLTRNVRGRGLSLTPAVSVVTASGVRSSSALVWESAVFGSASRTGVNRVRQNGACRLLREVRRASATRREIRDATVAASVALGEAAIPQPVRAPAFDCRSVALSPGDCESRQTLFHPNRPKNARFGSGDERRWRSSTPSVQEGVNRQRHHLLARTEAGGVD